MKAQAPALGILRTNDFGDSKWYQVVCGCGQPDHTLTVEVEADDMGVNVNTYVTVKTDHWSQSVKKRYDIDSPWLQEWDWFWKDLVNGVVTRLKLTWAVWTKGYVQTESTIAMSEQQALNYAETLKSAITDVKEFRRKETQSQENQQAIKAAQEQDCV
jgi:hypothetical protein